MKTILTPGRTLRAKVAVLSLVVLIFSSLQLSQATHGQSLEAHAELATRFAGPSLLGPGLPRPSQVLAPRFLELLKERGIAVSTEDNLAVRILADFGAVFTVERESVVIPPRYIFADAPEVLAWQENVPRTTAQIANVSIELQIRAINELAQAQAEARDHGLNINPASSVAGRRSYADTVALWESRVRPAAEHWVVAGRLSRADANRLLALTPRDQVTEVLRLEEDGLYFSTNFDKSILYSVAAPGTSQHLSMLALDVREYDNAEVRAILARHGWFQTVYSDLPHFTFLGVAEKDLPGLGLVAAKNAGHTFWIVEAWKARGAAPGEPDVTEVCPF